MSGLGLNFGLGIGKRATGDGGGGGGGDLASLNTILNAMTLDINPIEANVTKDGSNLISAVAESGTVEGTWAQSTEANKPTWVADPGNGKPAIQIVDTVRSLGLSATYNTYFSTAEAFLIAALDVQALVDTGDDLLCCAGSGDGRLGLIGGSVDDTVRAGHFDGSIDRTGNTGALALNTRYIVGVRHLGGNVGISLNGGAWVETASGDTGTPDTTANWRLGVSDGGSAEARYWRVAGDNAYPGDTEYANIVSLLSSVYDVTT